MNRVAAHEGGNPPAQALQDGQTMQRSTGWMGALLLVQSRTRQRRYTSLSRRLSTLLTLPQMHFNLTDATHWMSHYNGFSYEEFYEFIVDFFEADATQEAQEASAKLLEWWNKYISDFIATPATADLERPQSSVPEVRGHACGRTQVSATNVACDPATAASCRPVIQPTLVVYVGLPMSTYCIQISSPFLNFYHPMCEPWGPACGCGPRLARDPI